MATEASVRGTVAENAIVVFSDPSCPYCDEAKRALTANGNDFLAIECDSSLRSVLRSMTGASSVPSVWVKGVWVGGCNDGKEPWMGIKKLIKNGDLAKRLSA